MQFNYKIKYLIIILLLIMGYIFLITLGFPENQTLCIFKNITGIPCPSCGSTRATLLLFQGDIKGSLMMNPFGLLTNLFILISIIWIIRDILKNSETFLPFLKKDLNIRIKALLMVIIIANWIWNITKGL